MLEKEIDSKKARKVLSLEYDGCADLMAFVPADILSDQARESWLSQSLRCALLGNPASVRCASLVGRGQESELDIKPSDVVFSPITDEIVLSSEGLLNAFPFLKQIKANYESFQSEDQPLILMLAGVRQSDELDKKRSKTQQQSVTAMHAMRSMSAALNQILPGFCELKTFRLQDIAGLAQSRLDVPKDDFQALTLIYQMQMLMEEDPNQAIAFTACMTRKPGISRDMIDFFELGSAQNNVSRDIFPRGVELFYVDGTRSETADRRRASELIPVFNFKTRLEKDNQGLIGNGQKLSQVQLAEIYDRMTTFLHSSDYLNIRQKPELQDIANNDYTRALKTAFQFSLDPAHYQKEEASMINNIVGHLSSRKTFSSQISDNGRNQRLNQLRDDLQALVNAQFGAGYKKGDFKERTQLDGFLQHLRKETEPDEVRKGSQVSIRSVQEQVNMFKNK